MSRVLLELARLFYDPSSCEVVLAARNLAGVRLAYHDADAHIECKQPIEWLSVCRSRLVLVSYVAAASLVLWDVSSCWHPSLVGHRGSPDTHVLLALTWLLTLVGNPQQCPLAMPSAMISASGLGRYNGWMQLAVRLSFSLHHRLFEAHVLLLSSA